MNVHPKNHLQLHYTLHIMQIVYDNLHVLL